MEEMTVILYDVSFFVEIQLEDDSVVGFAQIVYRKQRPDNVCNSGSEELRVILVSGNEFALPLVSNLLSTGIGVKSSCKSVSSHWIVATCLSWYHRCCRT